MDRLDHDMMSLLERISKVANQSSMPDFAVGGFVRDLFLNVSNKDIDIVVEGDGILFASLLAEEFGGQVKAHEKFGTAVVLFPSGDKIDVAMTRFEHYDHPAALPTVEQGSIKSDLYRRDFTINSLAVKLNEEDAFCLLDFLDGERDIKNKAIIIITSDRGFAGSFNSSVIRLAEKEIEKFGKDKVQLFCLGKKASEYFSKRDYNVVQSFYDFWKDMTFDNASDISETFITAFNSSAVDEVHVIYNRFRTLASQDLMMEKVLPIDFTEDYNVKNYNYDYEPNQERIVESLLPKHLKVQMWQQMLESYSSEEAARMIAMDNATENAKEIIKELKLEFNKARQAAITTEMLEIVGGAEALVD